MVKSEGFVVIDGTSGIEEQQQLVRKTIMKLLPRQEEEQKQLRLQQQFERQNKVVVTANN
jgi:hypothetical protein